MATPTTPTDLHTDQRPVIWVLGPAGSGQTSIVAALVDQWRPALRQDLTAATPTAEMLDWPLEAPQIRFLITTGLNAEGPYDPAEDIAAIGAAPAMILAVLSADEPEPERLRGLLAQLRLAGRDWPILLVQTGLHRLYPPGAGHPMPYPYGPDGVPGPAAPVLLAGALKAQRTAFAGLAKGFVPVDFTTAEQGLPPGDYGHTALQAAIHRLAPAIAAALKPPIAAETGLWARAIIPWALAAAVADALPGLGGVAALLAQAMLLRAVTRRFGLASDGTNVANGLGVLATGLVLRSGLMWLTGGLGPVWAAAALAAWTFLASCAMGAVAIRFCRSEANGARPSAGRTPG